MAPIPSLKKIPCPIVHAQAAVTGWDSPYTADSIVRYYQSRTLADWQRDTGDQSPSVEIVAGIGVLTLTQAATQFTPRHGTTPPPPAPLPAPPDLLTSRLATCTTCDRWQPATPTAEARCTIAGCGCTGLANASRLSSKCPLGKW
jgi:hypothetical protein